MSKKKKMYWNPEANLPYPVFLDICREFFGCVWQLAIINGLLPALITQPTNSMYDRANWGRHSNLTAGWREGKEATIFFLSRGENNVCQSSSLPAVIIVHRKPWNPLIGTQPQKTWQSPATCTFSHPNACLFFKFKKKKKLMNSTDSHLPRLFNLLLFRY